MEDLREIDELVFVYGNLRKHGSEAYRMEGAQRVSSGEVGGKLFVKDGHPGFLPGGSGGCVVGELYRTSCCHLAELDDGGESANGGRYRRVKVPVYQEASTRFLGEAWAWLLDESLDDAAAVKSGDWCDVVRPRPWPTFTLLGVGCLAGFFAILAIGPPPLYPLPPRPVIPLAIVQVSLAASPVVGTVAAWWGVCRRERFPALGVIALALLLPLCALSLAGIVVTLAE